VYVMLCWLHVQCASSMWRQSMNGCVLDERRCQGLAGSCCVSTLRNGRVPSSASALLRPYWLQVSSGDLCCSRALQACCQCVTGQLLYHLLVSLSVRCTQQEMMLQVHVCHNFVPRFAPCPSIGFPAALRLPAGVAVACIVFVQGGAPRDACLATAVLGASALRG
jgi:hypothetical protein